MNNLLDTHTLIWFLNGDIDLSQKARNAIERGLNSVSIASIWEIAIKISLGKLELNTSFEEFTNQLALNNIATLPITLADTIIVKELPFHHRDPFDRIIIAQSVNNNLALISRDRAFSDYEVKLLW